MSHALCMPATYSSSFKPLMKITHFAKMMSCSNFAKSWISTLGFSLVVSLSWSESTVWDSQGIDYTLSNFPSAVKQLLYISVRPLLWDYTYSVAYNHTNYYRYSDIHCSMILTLWNAEVCIVVKRPERLHAAYALSSKNALVTQFSALTVWEGWRQDSFTELKRLARNSKAGLASRRHPHAIKYKDRKRLSPAHTISCPPLSPEVLDTFMTKTKKKSRWMTCNKYFEERSLWPRIGMLVCSHEQKNIDLRLLSVRRRQRSWVPYFWYF